MLEEKGEGKGVSPLVWGKTPFTFQFRPGINLKGHEDE